MSFAHGTKLYIDNVEILDLTNVGDLNLEATDIDMTDHQSVDGVMEFIKGLINPGEIPFQGSIKNVSNAEAIFAALKSRDNEEIKVVFPTSPLCAFTVDGYVKTFSVGLPHDGKIAMSGSIKASGVPVFGAVEQSNNLSALVVTEETLGAALTLIPTFAAGTYEYVTTADTSSTYVKVTPTAAAGVITVNGTAVATTEESGEIALGAAGSLTEVEIKVQETDKAAKIYTVTVARA